MTSVDDIFESIPTDFTLAENYPNPFNPSTNIPYALSKETDIRLDIHNLLGQREVTLIDGAQQAGEHTVSWDATDSPSGMYF